MEFRNARKQSLKQLLIYKEAQKSKIPKKLGKAVNIFFRHPVMMKCVSVYLGPGELEHELKQLKDSFRAFYVRHEDRQRILDETYPTFIRRWQTLTRIYNFQYEKIEWYVQNIETSIQNLNRIDSRKEAFNLDSLPGDIQGEFYTGYHRSLYELQLFMTDTNTNVVDKESILKFIKKLNNDLDHCVVEWVIHERIRIFERKLNLLSSLLRQEFDMETYILRRAY